jgi:hypothetical protein
VHTIVELLCFYQGVPWSKLKPGDVFELVLRNGDSVVVTNPREIAWGVGDLLCSLKQEERPQVLRHIAKALEGKSPRDDISDAINAYRTAKSEYHPATTKPKYEEVRDEYYAATGRDLDRRLLKAAGLTVRKGKPGKPLGARKRRAAAKTRVC